MFGRKYNKYILFVIIGLLMLTVKCKAFTNYYLTEKTATENMLELLGMFSLIIFLTLAVIEFLLLIINKKKLKCYENIVIIFSVCGYVLYPILPEAKAPYIDIIINFILLIPFIIISTKLMDKKELLKIFAMIFVAVSVVYFIYFVTDMGQLLYKTFNECSDFIICISAIMLIPSIVNFIILEINKKKLLQYELLKNIQLIVFIYNFYLLMSGQEFIDGNFLIHDVFFSQQILIYMVISLIYIMFDIIPIFLLTRVLLQIKKAKEEG